MALLCDIIHLSVKGHFQGVAISEFLKPGETGGVKRLPSLLTSVSASITVDFLDIYNEIGKHVFLRINM